MTAFTQTNEEADTAVLRDQTFDHILTQFYGFQPGGHIPVKRPRGRPLKIQPPAPQGTIKNTISDEDDLELHVEPNDARMLRMEFKQLTIEDGVQETAAIEDLAKIYNLSYRAVYSTVMG